ncbi:LysR substrate-binding domain-containing protein [Paraburkholderia dinghuensis]|uniref:LysR substrate-binding domain-containing protein n=1 Tax=Paraburkholderia dinghuensis TaxID=2305225 RepID=UPI001FE56D25|nr:LysR substrate-binding domain-containing protein [Paraburkholderia dinghuensis]
MRIFTPANCRVPKASATPCDAGSCLVADGPKRRKARAFEDERYCTQPYGSCPVIAFVNTAHRYAACTSITLNEFAGKPLLMREPGSTMRRALEDARKGAGLTARAAMEIGSREALREVVAHGHASCASRQREWLHREARKHHDIEVDARQRSRPGSACFLHFVRFSVCRARWHGAAQHHRVARRSRAVNRRWLIDGRR